MRRSSLLLLLALQATAGGAFAAPASPKKVAAPPRGRRPATKPSAAPSAASSGNTTAPADDSPYVAGEPAAPVAAPSAEEAPATTSGDAKLDEAPPPQAAAKEGPKPSPLNPLPNESPKNAPDQSPAVLDKLMSDIAALRARVAALTTSLFSSKLRVYVHTDGDDARVQNFVVTLDDGVVFRGDAGFAAEDEKVVYEHAVAPGSHVVGIEIERQDARGASYRTWQTTRFAIQVPERKTLEAIVVLVDDSSMGKDFPGDHDGKYDLRVRLRAKAAE